MSRRRDERVDPPPVGALQRLGRALDVAGGDAGERRDHRALHARRRSRGPPRTRPRDEIGNPASRMSTLRRASCSAISTFSGLVSAMPGACSPSRRVVSKIRTTSGSCVAHVIGGTFLSLSSQGIIWRSSRPTCSSWDVCASLAKSEELGEAGVGLRDPPLRERAVLDLGEDLPHLLARPLVDDARTARVVAPLGRVGDRVPHPRQPALVDQVDDELQLVQALEVRDLGLVAGLDERLEAVADQLGDARRTGPSARRTGRSRSPP